MIVGRRIRALDISLLGFSPERKASLRLLDGRAVEHEIGSERSVRPESTQFFEALSFDHFVLPGNRNTTGAELAIKRVITGVQIDAFDCRELLDVQHIFGVDCMRLWVRAEQHS